MPRFFWLTTSRADNVQSSVLHGGWCSKPTVARRVSEALAGPEPVICFLSARPTGLLAGIGRVASPPIPGQVLPWEGDGEVAAPMALQWLYRMDVPFADVESFRNAMDGGRAITSGPNGHEVDAMSGAVLANYIETRARSLGGGAAVMSAGMPQAMMAAAPMMVNPMMMPGAFPPMMMGPGGMPMSDLLSMTYEEYIEAFEKLKNKQRLKVDDEAEQAGDGGEAADANRGTSDGQRPATEDGSAPTETVSAPGPGVQLMSEEQYIEHCKQYMQSMGMPFDEKMVRDHYANMKASIADPAPETIAAA